MFEYRPQDKGGEKGEGADNEHDRRQHADEEWTLPWGTWRSSGGCVSSAASEPAMARAGRMVRNRPTSMQKPVVRL